MNDVAWVKLELDVQDPTVRVPIPQLDGVRQTTLLELGDEPGQRRRIYELNKECSADIPGRGEFFTWDEYRRVRFDVPQFRPEAQLLAAAGTELVGLCQLSHHSDADWAFVEMTGVRRGWRRRGIATALKLRAIDVARGWGVTHLRTVHHPGNSAIIAANRALGFTDAHTDWSL